MKSELLVIYQSNPCFLCCFITGNAQSIKVHDSVLLGSQVYLMVRVSKVFLQVLSLCLIKSYALASSWAKQGGEAMFEYHLEREKQNKQRAK